jgi:hypothetical protein
VGYEDLVALCSRFPLPGRRRAGRDILAPGIQNVSEKSLAFLDTRGTLTPHGELSCEPRLFLSLDCRAEAKDGLSSRRQPLNPSPLFPSMCVWEEIQQRATR